MKRNRRESGRISQRHGADGEDVAHAVLVGMGILRVEKITAPYIRVLHPVDKRYCRVVQTGTVSGDRTGILPGGRFVLVETKTRYGANLCWSDFDDHQPGDLTEHCNAGGVSLVVWVNDYGVNIMRWPIIGFDGPRKSITPERARELDVLGRASIAYLIEQERQKLETGKT